MRILNYIKRKVFFYKLKVSLYEALNHGDELINLVTKLAIGCENCTPQELKDQFIKELAGFAHEQAMKERGKEKNGE